MCKEMNKSLTDTKNPCSEKFGVVLGIEGFIRDRHCCFVLQTIGRTI